MLVWWSHETATSALRFLTRSGAHPPPPGVYCPWPSYSLHTLRLAPSVRSSHARPLLSSCAPGPTPAHGGADACPSTVQRAHPTPPSTHRAPPPPPPATCSRATRTDDALRAESTGSRQPAVRAPCRPPLPYSAASPGFLATRSRRSTRASARRVRYLSRGPGRGRPPPFCPPGPESI